MAIRIEKNEEAVNGNGWTHYQQLVLNELERHEEKLNILEKEIVSLRLAHARLEMEIKANTDSLSKVLAELKSIDSNLTTKISSLNSEREKMNGDLSLLKWKVAGAATFVSLVLTAIFQGAVKFFLQGG